MLDTLLLFLLLPQIEFDLKDLNTVVDVIEEQKKQQRVKH